MGGPSPPTVSSYGGQPNYIPQSQPAVDTSYTNALNTTSAYLPAAQTATNNIINNPYTSGLVPAAEQGSAYTTNTAIPQAQATNTAMYNQGMATIPYAQQALQQGFDPENALYDRTAQQLMDQQQAINAQSGLGSSAYGAGVTGNTMSNFNIDWQAQQLANQSQAASTYSNLIDTSGKELTDAAAVAQQVPSFYTGAAALPYSTYNATQSAPINAIGQYENVTTPLMNAAGNYLGIGTQASQQFNNAQMEAYNAQVQAYQSMMGGLGSLLGSSDGSGGSIGGDAFGDVSSLATLWAA